MKASTPALRALLATGRYVYADCYTVTLNGGAVLRWTSADTDQLLNGQRFVAGPAIDRGAISEKIGFEVATLQVTIDAGDDDLVNGTPLIGFIAARGLDGANVKLERAFRPSWAEPITGSVIRFAGRVTSVGNIAGSRAEVTVSSWAVLLNVNMPPNLYQVGCLHTVYDAGCGLDPETFAATGTISVGGSVIAFGSSLAGHAGFYDQGRLVFLTGVNAGLTRSVHTVDVAGGFRLVAPLQAAPNAGDTFRAYAGCPLTTATCQSRFNNLGRFKGTPYVPVPETAT